MDYYNIDSILSSAVKVPCLFPSLVYGYEFLSGRESATASATMGSFRPNADDMDVENDKEPNHSAVSAHENVLSPNTRIELPFWLIEALTSRDESLVTLNMPRFLNEHVMNDLEADAKSVDIRRLCPWFFAFVAHFFSLVQGDSKSARTVAHAFLSRLAEIMDYTQSVPSQDLAFSSFTQSLDETEKQLYQIGMESAALKKRWQDRKIDRITKVTPSISSTFLRKHF